MSATGERGDIRRREERGAEEGEGEMEEEKRRCDQKR